jgi:hypothetical protein
LDFVQRAKADVELSEEDHELAEKIPQQAIRLWLTRFHADKMNHEFLRFALIGIDQFTKRWPKAAVEVSKDVGWPDDERSTDVSSPGSKPVGVQPL